MFNLSNKTGLRGLKPNGSLKRISETEWESSSDDPWFLYSGSFRQGSYKLTLHAFVADGLPVTPVRLYFAASADKFNARDCFVFPGLPYKNQAHELKLEFNLPFDVQVLRIDPMDCPGRFHLLDFHLEKSAGNTAPPPAAASSLWTYCEDGLATEHNCDFMNDGHFLKSYQAGKNTGSWGQSEIHWRAYIACWAAKKAASLDGDFVECGVNRGGLALTVMHFTNFQNLSKKFYLMDSFSGLCEKYVSEAERRNGVLLYKYEDCYEFVCETFKDFNNAVIVRGTIPDTLPEVKSSKVAFLSIDLNCAAPEIAAAEYFWEKLASGAVMLLDDYGWNRHIEQKHAFDQFAAQRCVQVLPLPTGQGLIFKP